MARATDFSLRALYDALDEERRVRGITWSTLADDVNRHRTTLRPIAASTIAGLKDKPRGEGDGILQMLIWLDRTPESFIPAVPDADDDRYRLPRVTRGQILRWDTVKLHAALDEQRREYGLTWAQAAREIGGFTPGMLTNLAKGPKIGFPRVMRLPRWLDQPAARFTRIAFW